MTGPRQAILTTKNAGGTLSHLLCKQYLTDTVANITLQITQSYLRSHVRVVLRVGFAGH